MLKPKPKVLFICYDGILPVTHGGRIANFGYYYPLSQTCEVDYICPTPIPKKIPHYTKADYSNNAFADMVFSYFGVEQDDRIYDFINSRSYDAIFTTYPLDRGRIKLRPKIIKLVYDVHSRHFLEIPELRHHTTELESFERTFQEKYDHVISCSPIGAMTYIPFFVSMKTPAYPYQAKSKTILATGSQNWHRFTRSLEVFTKLSMVIDGKIYLHTKNRALSGEKIIWQSIDQPLQAGICSYSLQPLTYFSGIPSKSLESLSHGIPVITTPEMQASVFRGHRHVYSFRDLQEINELLSADIRQRDQTYQEIQADLEKERGLAKVVSLLTALI